MDHGYFQNLLSAYHDRSLTPEEMRMVEDHLAGCAECRQRLESLARLDQLVQEKSGLGESDYWESAAQKIEKKLGFGQETKTTDIRRGKSGLGWKLAAVAASVAVLTFVALHETEILKSTREATDRQTQSEKQGAPHTDSQPAADAVDQTTGYQTASPTMGADTSAGSGTELSEEYADRVAEEVRRRTDEVDKATPPEPQSLHTKGRAQAPAAAAEEPAVRRDLVMDFAAGNQPDLATVDTIQARGKTIQQAVAPAPSPGRAGETLRAALPPQDTKGAVAAASKPSEPVVVARESLDLAEVRCLDYWQGLRDSLRPLVEEGKSQKSRAPEKLAQSAGMQKTLLNQPTDTVAAKPTALDRYLEACYRIALLTKDDKERDRAVGVLRDYANAEHKAGSETAAHYLKLLGEQP